MDTLGSRIRSLRSALRPTVSQRKLGEMCGWEGSSAQARIGNYENNTREPSISDLRILARTLQTTVAYLVGEEPPVGEGVADIPADYAVIPQYTALAHAGKGYDNDHVEIKGGLVFKLDWLRRMGLKVEHLSTFYAGGMSMYPTINDGDVLLMDSSKAEPVTGKVYALRRPDGSISVKRLIQTHTQGWIIRSDNPDKARYPDEPATDSEIGHLLIEGRIVWHAGSL